MTEPIITRALVRQYLIATGWELREGRWHQEGRSSFEDRFVENGGLSPLIRAGFALDVDHVEVSARLGLCAAAEHLRERRLRAERLGEHHVALAESDASAHDLLKRAGIDPERWEAAR